MSNLGNFMKKRTRDLLIGAGLVGVSTVGALAFLVDSSQTKTANVGANTAGSGVIQSSNGTRVMTVTETKIPIQNDYAQNGREYSFQNPSSQTSQGSFTNNTNFNTSLPTPNPQPSNHYHSSSAECASEALAVGIKHFRYDETPRSELVASGYGSDSKFLIHRDAKPALQEMVRAARADGVTLTPGSIFRGVDRQRQIVNNKKSQGQSARQIYRTSSHPGYSEHHTGLAVDFTPINNSFANTEGYRWLRNNANKYGFYQSFTADYSAYSGVAEESWHWRYEGRNGEFAPLFFASKNRQC